MKKIAIVFIAVLTFGIVSCSDFLDVNTDPNNAPTSTPALTLPAAIASSASCFAGYYNILGGFWVQYWTQDNGSNQYKDIDAYNIQQSTLNTTFSEMYSGALNDYKFVREQSKATGDWNLYLMGTVMQAYSFQLLADIYDQIPLDEALQGAGNPNPHYLSGQQVYDTLIARIDDALSKDFSALTNTNPGESDILFGGNISKWKRFANTLKLKIYLRQIYARPDVADAGIKALFSSGATFLEDDAAMTQFIDQENKSNPLYEMDQRKLNTKQNIKGSKTFIDFLLDAQDPRIGKLFIPNAKKTFIGLPQGDFGVPTTVIDPATICRARITATEPVYFLSKAESYFLQSEAAARGYGGDDEALYVSGISASFDQLDTLDASATLTAPGGPYAYPSSGNFDAKLKAIITQKWIALAGFEGAEAFSERNRTHYPAYSDVTYGDSGYELGDLVYPIGGVTGTGIFPKRLLFPETERTRNINTPAQVPATTKIWWDTKPN